MPAIAEKPITPEELLALNDEKLYELVDGRLVEKNMGYFAARLASLIFWHLENYFNRNPIGTAACEGTFEYMVPNTVGGTRVRKPDASVVLNSRFADEPFPTGHAQMVPDLAVEVISPNDLTYDVSEKVSEYFSVGVQEVWLVYPNVQQVSTRRRGLPREFELGDTLVAPELLPGFELKLTDLFKNFAVKNR